VTEEALRAEMVRRAHELHSRGWVANHDGNLTARLGEDRFLATPTAISKGAVRAEMLIVVDGTGAVVQGTRKGFSELKLHLAAYRARPDVLCVVHAHPPNATGFAVAGQAPSIGTMAEPIVSIGPTIPLVPFGLPGDPELEAALAQALSQADVVLLANHGLLVTGPDLETCALRIELVEHLCQIELVARQLGGPVALPNSVVETLIEKHRGLFPRETGSVSPLSFSSPRTTEGAAHDLVVAALRRFRS
jgi:L-fuculose-phosphate aldolase